MLLSWDLTYSTLFPGGSDGKASAYNAGDPGLIPGLGRSLGEGNGNPLQYSCLENSMDGGAWWATVHGVAKSRTRLSDFNFTFLSPCVWPCGCLQCVACHLSNPCPETSLRAKMFAPLSCSCCPLLGLPTSAHPHLLDLAQKSPPPCSLSCFLLSDPMQDETQHFCFAGLCCREIKRRRGFGGR